MGRGKQQLNSTSSSFKFMHQWLVIIFIYCCCSKGELVCRKPHDAVSPTIQSHDGPLESHDAVTWCIKYIIIAAIGSYVSWSHTLSP